MKIGAQFYTLREFTKTKEGFIEALDRVAAMGYEGVQLSGVGCMARVDPLVTAEEARALLDERGLTCAATHRPLEALQNDADWEIEFHETLGAGYTAIGSAPDWAWGDGVEEFLSVYQSIHRRFAAGGIAVGYHNHAFEFEPRPGGSFFDTLRDKAPWLPMELDTYWVHHSGKEVVPVIESLTGRLPVVHIKDMSPFGWKVSYAPIGEGNLNWDAILPAFEKAGTEWLLVELDECPRDPYDCLESSIKYLRSRG